MFQRVHEARAHFQRKTHYTILWNHNWNFIHRLMKRIEDVVFGMVEA